MRKDGKIGVRLLRAHYLNGTKKRAGQVIVLRPWAALQLVTNGIGRYTEPAMNRAMGRKAKKEKV